MSEQLDPTVINKQSGLPEGPVSKHIESLIKDAKREAVDGIIPEATITALLDQFYGSVLRAQGTEQGLETLDLLNFVATSNGSIEDEQGNPRDWREVFTRKNGVRRSVIALHQTVGDKLFTVPEIRFVDADKRVPILGSMDVIHGYLDTETESEAKLPETERAVAWKSGISEELHNYLHINGRSEAWASRHLLGSEIPGVKDDQAKWERSVEIAKKVGVDVDLITRSAEFLMRQKQSGLTVGRTVLRVTPTFDSLFK